MGWTEWIAVDQHNNKKKGFFLLKRKLNHSHVSYFATNLLEVDVIVFIPSDDCQRFIGHKRLNSPRETQFTQSINQTPTLLRFAMFQIDIVYGVSVFRCTNQFNYRLLIITLQPINSKSVHSIRVVIPLFSVYCNSIHNISIVNLEIRLKSIDLIDKVKHIHLTHKTNGKQYLTWNALLPYTTKRNKQKWT